MANKPHYRYRPLEPEIVQNLCFLPLFATNLAFSRFSPLRCVWLWMGCVGSCVALRCIWLCNRCFQANIPLLPKRISRIGSVFAKEIASLTPTSTPTITTRRARVVNHIHTSFYLAVALLSEWRFRFPMPLLRKIFSRPGRRTNNWTNIIKLYAQTDRQSQSQHSWVWSCWSIWNCC